jgi:hypothetical protein
LHFQKWQQAGFFLRLWQTGLAEYDEMEAIAWNWQRVNLAKARSLGYSVFMRRCR